MTTVARALALLSVVVAGCGSSPPSAHSARTSIRPVEPASDSTALVPATARRSDPCNVRSEEAKVGPQMTERGAALVFTTSDDVHELRRRVSDLTILTPLRTVQPRFDNVHGGVRIVFDAESAGDVATVQSAARKQASEIAKTCGLVLAAEGEWAAEQQREESSSDASDSRASSDPIKARPPARDKQPEPEAEKPDTKQPPTKADAKPEPEKKPKPEEPKESEKPKDDKAPKEDEKPPVPPLPGPRPDPIVPE